MKFFASAFVVAALIGLAAPLPAFAQGASLEARVKQIEDKEAITRLIYDYGRTLDSADYVGYGNLFAKNGTWSGRYTGPAQITEAMTKTYKEPAGSFHIFSNIYIDVHGDSATGLLKWHFVVPNPDDTATIYRTGTYKDEYVREEGQWKFLHRVLVPAFPTKPAAPK